MRSGFEGQDGTGRRQIVVTPEPEPEPEPERQAPKTTEFASVPFHTMAKPERSMAYDRRNRNRNLNLSSHLIILFADGVRQELNVDPPGKEGKFTAISRW